MPRIPEIDRVLDQGVQIPKTSSTNWDIPVNDNWDLLNSALKNKYNRISNNEQIIDSPTLVLSSFKYVQKIQGKIESADQADTARQIQNPLTINNESYNGEESKTFELVDSSEVGNSAGKIPRFSNDGHLVLPNGVEIW